MIPRHPNSGSEPRPAQSRRAVVVMVAAGAGSPGRRVASSRAATFHVKRQAKPRSHIQTRAQRTGRRKSGSGSARDPCHRQDARGIKGIPRGAATEVHEVNAPCVPAWLFHPEVQSGAPSKTESARPSIHSEAPPSIHSGAPSIQSGATPRFSPEAPPRPLGSTSRRRAFDHRSPPRGQRP